MKQLLLLLLVTGSASAGPSLWNLTVRTTLPETIDVPEEDARYFESFLQLDWYQQEEKLPQWSLREDYRSFHQPDMDNLKPASNGDAHALSVRWQADYSNWQFELAPTLSTSSNVLVHPDEMQVEDWQLHGSLFWLHSGMSKGLWRWGIIADSRLGRYLLYPSVQWQKISGDTLVKLGLPDSNIDWHFQPDWSVGLSAGPDGGQWHVRDKNFEQSSDLYQKRWNATLYLQWSPTRFASFQMGLSHYWGQEWEYRLEDGQTVFLSIPDLNILHFSLQLTSW